MLWRQRRRRRGAAALSPVPAAPQRRRSVHIQRILGYYSFDLIRFTILPQERIYA
jgi:hypothetical protein